MSNSSPATKSSSAGKQSPRVTVIIPVKDDAERLDHCLERLAHQSTDEIYEILVVDNGSTESPQHVVDRYPLTRLLHEPSHGSYAARNAGLRQARGEIIAFTDADCLPDETWLEHGVKSLESAGSHVWIGGHIDVFHRNPNKPSPGELWDEFHGFPQQYFVEQEHFAATANLIAWRRTFEDIGPFQQTFISSGDREWGNRATDNGVRGIFDPTVVVRHPSRPSLRALRAKNIRMTKGNVQLRSEEGRALLSPKEVLIGALPPIPTLARDIPKLRPQTMRSRLAYTWAALYITYTVLFDRLRIVGHAWRTAS